MILLYPSTEQEFADNGLGALSDAISCQAVEELNGAFELTLEYPVTGIHYGDIVPRCIIFARPNPYSDPQPFRAYRITKPLSGRVTVYAEHISYDLSGYPVESFTASSAAEAMSKLKSAAVVDNPFVFYTDKATAAKMEVTQPSSIRSLLGGSTGSILDVYGGEFEFDRWTVKLLGQRGSNNGVSIRYGKNLTDLEQDENISNVSTGIYPYYKDSDGNLVTLPEKIINAPGTYDFAKIIPVDLSDKFEEQPTEEQLREAAEKYVTDNNIGVPTVSITVAFQPLEQTEEYKDIALLEKVKLGDTVNVEYDKLGVSATAKCVKTTYDALKDRYISVELGDAKTNIADTIVKQQQEINEKPSDSMMKDAITNLTETLLGAKGGAVRIADTDQDGLPDTIFLANSNDLNTAQKVWRFNFEGWGASENGINGPYVMGATFESGMIADFITTGILTANLIKAGILQSSNGKTSINMETGDCNMYGTYTSEWTRSDGTGEVTMNPNGITFYLDGNHRGSIYLAENGETYSSAAGFSLHRKKFVGDHTAPDQDKLFAWMDDDDKRHISTDFLTVLNTASGTIFPGLSGGGIKVENGLIKDWNMSGTWSGTLNFDRVKLVFKNGLLADAINT